MSRQIVLDTETTGLDTASGHRIIEIGCVELRERRLTGHNLHVYLQPDRTIDAGAIEVHGITNEFLADKPRFEDVVDKLLAYLDGAELIIHNAPFDVGFLNFELQHARYDIALEDRCTVTDTLALARKHYPGQRNSLDALCRRLGVDNARRTLHGALLDAEILADVYLCMTGGQATLLLDPEESRPTHDNSADIAIDACGLKIVNASAEELKDHELWLDRLEDGGACVWRDHQRREGSGSQLQ